MPSTGELFPQIESFAHAVIFDGIEHPWEVLPKVHAYIEEKFVAVGDECSLPDGIAKLMGSGIEGMGMLYCEKPIELERELVCTELKIKIGAGTKIEPSAVIKGSAIIGKNCDIRQSAYLRGGVIAGDHCTLGHATEIKNSILMNHSEAGHFNYVGDSVIGSYVNLGAGTKLANLKFRTPEEKRDVAFPIIKFIHNGEMVDTGLSKLGAIIGDYTETGCNSVISPAVIFGTECMVYPNVTVASGIYPARKIVKK